MKEGEQIRTTLIREIVRDFMEDHLGCTPKQIVFGTGLTEQQVITAYRSIRNEWRGRLERRLGRDAKDQITRGLFEVKRVSHDAIFSMMAPRKAA